MLDFTPIVEIDPNELSEFSQDQIDQLTAVLTRVAIDPVNNFRENAELRGTLNYLAQKP